MDKVTEYIAKHAQWSKELELLRSIILKTNLEETIKWGAPTYTYTGKNIIGIGAFKSYVGLWFFQGALLKDNHNVLYNAQEGKTKALRQWRFTEIAEIDEAKIHSYIFEAISNQEKGLEIKPDTNKKWELAPELKSAMQTDEILEAAFNNLTPGRQKEYSQYITEAKREATKLSRLEKITPMIYKGIGLYDKYKNC